MRTCFTGEVRWMSRSQRYFVCFVFISGIVTTSILQRSLSSTAFCLCSVSWVSSISPPVICWWGMDSESNWRSFPKWGLRLPPLHPSCLSFWVTERYWLRTSEGHQISERDRIRTLHTSTAVLFPWLHAVKINSKWELDAKRAVKEKV